MKALVRARAAGSAAALPWPGGASSSSVAVVFAPMRRVSSSVVVVARRAVVVGGGPRLLRGASVVAPSALPPLPSFSPGNESESDEDAPPRRARRPFSLSLVRAPYLDVFDAPLLPTARGAVRLFEPRCLAALDAALRRGGAGQGKQAAGASSFIHLVSPATAPRGLLSEKHGLPRVGSLASVVSVDRSARDGSVVVEFEGVRRVEVLAVDDDEEEEEEEEEETLADDEPRFGGGGSGGGFSSVRHKVASCVFLDDEPTVAAAARIPSSVPVAPPPPEPAVPPRNSGNSTKKEMMMSIAIDNPREAALEREMSAALSAVVALAARRARASGSPEPKLPAAVALLAPPPVAAEAAARDPKRETATTPVAQGLRAGGFRAAASAVDAWRSQNKPSSSVAAIPANPYASALVAPPAEASAFGGSLHRRRELFSFAAASALELDVPVAAALLLSTSTEARLEFVLGAVREHLSELTAREALRGVVVAAAEEEEQEEEES